MARKFAVSIDLQKNELQNARVQNLGSAPGSPVEGQIYYDTVDHKLYFRDNSGWVSAGAVSFGTPVTIGTANADGAASTAARSDHVHQARSHDHSSATDGTALAPATLTFPSTASPAQTAEGSVVWDSDDDVLTVGDGAARKQFLKAGTAVASTQAIGDSAAAGTSLEAARIDHKHAMPAFATNTVALGTAAAAGSAATLIRSDATIAAFDATSPSTQAFGDSAVVGVIAFAARRDHKHAMPAHDGTAHSAISISSLSAPTGSVAWNSQKITGLLDPTAAQDAATKNYVDTVAQGIDVRGSVRAATTAAGTLASSFENGDVIDGVTLATGNRILIKNQAAGAENGIYVVAASGAPTRATDADVSAEVTPGMFVFVEEGTANADSGWVMTNDGAVTLGTTALTFAQFSGAGQITAGGGLTKTGNTLDVVAGTGMVVNTDDIAVLRTDANGRVPLRYAASFGDGAATSYNIDHNLNSLDVIVQVFQNSDGAQIEPDVTHSTVNRVVLAFAVAPTSNQFRVVVIG